MYRLIESMMHKVPMDARMGEKALRKKIS